MKEELEKAKAAKLERLKSAEDKEEKSLIAKVGPPNKRLCLFAYEVAKACNVPTNDMRGSEPLLRSSVENEKKFEKRRIIANKLHRKYFDRRFTPQIWYRALSVKDDDEAGAKQWIEQHGATAQQRKYAPLVRHLILEKVPEHECTDKMFTNCMFYCSGHQFVILIPPHTNPWCANNDKWLGRVYGLKNGLFIQDTKDITLKYQATRACVDPLKDLIWFGYLQNDLIFQSYKNHGPAACFYEIADNEEEDEEEDDDEEEEEEEEDEEEEVDKEKEKEAEIE
eukprot:18224_1